MLLPLLLAADLAGKPADLVARGVIIARDATRSVALLRAGVRTKIAAVGETAFGGRVVAIDGTSVTMEYGMQRVELHLPGTVAGPSPAQAGQSANAAGDPSSASRAMARADVERRLGNEIPRILTDTALFPVSDEGRVVGLAITRIAEGSLLTEAGLRAGDVLTEVNGIAIDSLATLAGLYPRLQRENDLRAVVLRNGQPVSLHVTLR